MAGDENSHPNILAARAAKGTSPSPENLHDIWGTDEDGVKGLTAVNRELGYDDSQLYNLTMIK